MSHCDFAAGWAGGVVGLMVGHPLDTIKVNQQTQGIGIQECTRTIYQKKGLKGFFRGMGFPLIAQGAMNSVFFGVYGFTMEQLDKSQWNYNVLSAAGREHQNCTSSATKESKSQGPDREISYTNCFIAGFMGGAAQLSIACPADVIKIKLQTKSAKHANFRGPLVLISHILRTQGLGGLYQGVGTMIFRDLPSSGVYMLVYELGLAQVNKWTENRNDVANSIGLFFAGGIAGCVSWWLILPLDTIKSHIQSQDQKSPSYRGAWDSTKFIFQQQGLKGFFRGFGALTLRAFPVNGATLLTYEWFTFLCHYLNDTSNSRINAIKNS